MNSEIQELIDKRNSSINLLNSYFSTGRNLKEPAVGKAIKRIKHLEEQLLSKGYSDFDKIKDDGTFASSKENEVDNTAAEVNKADISTESEEDKNENTEIAQVNKGKKKLDKIEKSKSDKLGVSIKQKNLKNIHKLSNETGRTPNNVVNCMLESIYDPDNNKFIIDFQKKENVKNTSYLLEERYIKAIDKIAKKTQLSKSDIFNTLLEKALEEYV